MVQQFSYKKNEYYKGGTSYPEQFFLRCLRQVYSAEHRKKEPDLGLEFDIEIKELNLRIEYSGDYWHIGKEENDRKRREYCKDNSINYIEILESQGKRKTVIYKQDLYTRIYIYVDSNFERKNEKLISILKYILKQYGHNIMEIDIERAVCESFIFCKQYDYNIIRKNGKIVGTEDKIYINTTELIECKKEEIEDIKSEDGIVIINGIDKDKDKNNLKMKIINDDTLVRSTISDKEFRKMCKRVINNWNMYEG